MVVDSPASGSSAMTKPPSRHILFAHGVVGLEITRFLLERFPGDIAAVVTTGTDDIHALAVSHTIPVHIYRKDADFVSCLPDKIDLGILAWWPFIIKAPLLDLPASGFINTHPSLLPHNRGKNPNFWAIVEQRPFGVTLHQINAGVDSGPVIAQCEIPYDWRDTGGSIYKKALAAMVELFKETWPAIRTGTIKLQQQDASAGSLHFASELDPASQIDLDASYTARDLLNLLRARTFDTYPACYFTDAGEEFEVRLQITRKKNG